MFDPVIPVRDAARSVALHFQKAVGAGVVRGRAQAMAKAAEVLACEGAIVIGETHGIYSHADFVTDFLPLAAAAGADRLYVEMFHTRHQPKIDAWQDNGDSSGLIWLMNKMPGYSEKMWERFWQVLQKANECGLRVITIEPDQLPHLYPGMGIFYRNMKWQDRIEADQRLKPQERPFVLYCGEHHTDRVRCCNTRPIHAMLKAAALVLKEGADSLVRPFRIETPATMLVERAHDQTPLTHLGYHRNRAVIEYRV